MRRTAGLGMALVLVLLASTVAQGAATRTEYVALAEPVCIAAERQATRQAKRKLRKLKPRLERIENKLEPFETGKFKKSDLRKIFSLFVRFTAKLTGPSFHIFDLATTQLRAITPAPGDETAIATWLSGRVEFTRLNFAANRAGRRGKVKRYFGLLLKAEAALRAGQAPINAFGFQRCFIELPKIGIGPAPIATLRALTD